MTEQIEGAGTERAELVDPRALLAEWANANDEWVRLVVAEVITTGRPVGDPTIDKAYQLFRQEKALDERGLPVVEKLSTEARLDESAPPLALTRLSEVRGVNALVAGAVIEPHEGLTILYGENGTGKTGYSRIFKALADSRTADVTSATSTSTRREIKAQSLSTRSGRATRHLIGRVNWGFRRSPACQSLTVPR